MNDLSFSCSYTLHDVPGCGLAMEAIIVGEHSEWPDGAVIKCISSAIATQKPSVLIINVTRFQCVVWSDITGEFTSAYTHLHRLGGSRMCRVVAQGKTAELVETLMRGSLLLPFFGGRVFCDFESALSDAKSSLGVQ